MKKFYAQKDALGFPILGTMMSSSEVPVQSNIIEIKALMGLGSHPAGFKYYVRKDEKDIIPNSLFVSYDLQDPAETFDLHLVPTTTTTSTTTTTTIAPSTTTTTTVAP